MQADNDKYNETVQPNTAFLNELNLCPTSVP